MKRPSKSEIRAAVEKLKVDQTGTGRPVEPYIGKLSEKKSSQRIRKQGI